MTPPLPISLLDSSVPDSQACMIGPRVIVTFCALDEAICGRRRFTAVDIPVGGRGVERSEGL